MSCTLHLVGSSELRSNNENDKSELYARMITDFMWPAIGKHDLNNILFQQADATCHIMRADIALFREKFPGRRIASWQWKLGHEIIRLGYMKDRSYADKPLTLEHKKSSIRQATAEIEKWSHRMKVQTL